MTFNTGFLTALLSVSAVSFAAGMVPLLTSVKVPVEKWLGLSLGTLCGLVLFHLIPDSVEVLGLEGTLIVAFGIAGILALEHVFLGKAGCCSINEDALCVPLMLGMALCAVDDGILMGLTYSTQFRTEGWIGILLHKSFEAMTVSAALAARPGSRIRTVGLMLLFALLPFASGLGVYGLTAASKISQVNIIPAISSGILLFIILSRIHSVAFKRDGASRGLAALGNRVCIKTSFLGFAGMLAAKFVH